MKFKTNVMCGACIDKVTPHLNRVVGEGNWEVDTRDPKKILTVKNDSVSSTDVVNALTEAGYKSEVIA